MRKWFTGHKEVQPLVQLRLRRTRFVGLKNDSSKGLWATLDKDILTRSCSSKLLISENGLHMSNTKPSEMFPHAILEIRTEGSLDTDVIAALDASYLVRLFNLTLFCSC